MKNNNSNSGLSEAQIQNMLKQIETTDSELLKAAALKTAEEEKNRQIERYQVVIRGIKAQTENAVLDLRTAREHEKQVKDRLNVINAAEQAFMKDGNLDAYVKAIFPEDRHSQVILKRDLENGSCSSRRR